MDTSLFRPSYKAAPAIAVLGLLCFLIAVARGLGETFAVFLAPMSATFGWDRATVTSIYSVRQLVGGFASLLTGLLFDFAGARLVYCLGLLQLGAVYLGSAYATSLWQFYVLMGLLGGLGGTMTGVVPAQAIIAKWFDRSRTTALAIAFAALGVGTMIFAPIAQALLEHMGWREVYSLFGSSVLVLAILVSLLPWRTIQRGSPEMATHSSLEVAGGSTFLQAIATPDYWLFFAIYVFTAYATYGTSVQSVAFLASNGFTGEEAALAFGAAGTLSVVGMLVSGFLADRIGNRAVTTASYVCTMSGIGSLLCVHLFSARGFILAYILLFGVSLGGRGPIITGLVSRRFGGRRRGSIYGGIDLGQGVGAALGVYASGLLFDISHDYTFALVSCICSAAVGLALFFVVHRNQP